MDERRRKYETTDRSTASDGLDAPEPDGLAAEHVILRFSNYKTGTFDYDAATGLYRVGQYGGAYTDGNTGAQVGVTNVLFLETDIYQIAGDSAGRLSVKLTGTGNGAYFCGGKSIPIQWSKADRNSPFVYRLTDGTPLTLGQGTSYVCILDPDTSKVEITA